ncbi:hypothetical protein GCM10022252_00680 [Streptosporangium oxazolinicum]|uniref:Uncharacterized protein n=1 Tax=Streptosporangium oxazolinicum TaxID=909287 RepID=A0ABP8A7T1_9ACTN
MLMLPILAGPRENRLPALPAPGSCGGNDVGWLMSVIIWALADSHLRSGTERFAFYGSVRT